MASAYTLRRHLDPVNTGGVHKVTPGGERVSALSLRGHHRSRSVRWWRPVELAEPGELLLGLAGVAIGAIVADRIRRSLHPTAAATVAVAPPARVEQDEPADDLRALRRCAHPVWGDGAAELVERLAPVLVRPWSGVGVVVVAGATHRLVSSLLSLDLSLNQQVDRCFDILDDFAPVIYPSLRRVCAAMA